VTTLEESYRRCRELNRRHGTTYYWSTWLLPTVKRHHVHALYGFCRYADDIVDDLGPAPVAQRERALRDFGDRFFVDLDAGRSDDPVLKAVVHTVRAFDIDPDCFRRFLRSMAMDLTVTAYPTFDDLLGYMDGSAAVIGEMMLPILEPSAPEATGYARDLGFAFQLTNFCRDVNEDLDRGRVYLPGEDLDRFAAHDALRERRVTPGWVALMRFEIQRIRGYYRSADRGIPMLPAVSGRSRRRATTSSRRGCGCRRGASWPWRHAPCARPRPSRRRPGPSRPTGLPAPHGPSRGPSAQDGRHVPDGTDRPPDRPGDLGTPETGVVRDGHLEDPPLRVRRPHDHLERPAETAVGDAEAEQVVATGGAHRPEVVDDDPATAADPPGEDPVGDPGVHRPRPPGGGPPPEHEVGLPGGDRTGHERQVGPVEGAVAVHEADDVVGGGGQAGEAGRAEAPEGLVHHERTEPGGDLGRAVGRAVVDDDRPVPGRKRGEDAREGGALVEDRQDHVGHAGPGAGAANAVS
jgi:phytoene synthase